MLWCLQKLTASSDVGVLDSKDDLDILIDEFRRRFEEIMGNLESVPSLNFSISSD
jgi:hypothetical protein